MGEVRGARVMAAVAAARVVAALVVRLCVMAALVAAIHDFPSPPKSWMAGTRPAMTVEEWS